MEVSCRLFTRSSASTSPLISNHSHFSSTNISTQTNPPISFMVHTLMVNKVKFRELFSENHEIVFCCFHYLFILFKIVRWGNTMRNIIITRCILWHIYHCFRKFLVLEEDTAQNRGFVFSEVQEWLPKYGLWTACTFPPYLQWKW